VLCPCRDLRPDVFDDDIDGHDAKLASVDRHDRTVPAQMLAPARGIGTARHAPRSIGHLQRGIPMQRR
jgi:hypothetical protein